MEILKDVVAELWGMFWADRRLTAALLALVAVVALLAPQAPMAGLVLIALGPAAIIFAVVLISARQASR